MKILQINAALEYGSTGRNAVELSEELKANGHESWIAFSTGNSNIENTYRINTKIDSKFHGLMSRIFGLQGYFSYFATKRLLRFMDKQKFDIVNLGNLHGNFINIPLLFNYLLKRNVATVITLHDCFLYTGKCCHYTTEQCYKWQENCGYCSRIRKDNKSYFFDRTKKMLDMKREFYDNCQKLGVIGVSEWITEEAEKSILKGAVIKQIFNWVDLEVFRPQCENYRKKLNMEDKFVILGVAPAWGEAKGLYRFKSLAKIIPDDWSIVLVGDCNEDISEKNIIHISHVDDVKELVKYYNTADVFVNFSLEESFGKVTAEALSCGVPAVVPNTTANPELVGEKCGYVVNNTTPEEYYKFICKIKNNKKEYYSEYCRNFAYKNFCKKKNLKQYIDFFEKIAER